MSNNIFVEHIGTVEVGNILSQLNGDYEHSVALETLLANADRFRPQGQRMLDVLHHDDWDGPGLLSALRVKLGLQP